VVPLVVLVLFVCTARAEGGFFGGFCGALVGITGVVTCSNEFETTLSKYNGQDDGIATMDIAYCCAVSALRTCVINKVYEQCGKSDSAMDTANTLVSQVISTTTAALKLADNQIQGKCDGSEIYYWKESPVCWPVWGMALGLTFIGLLVLSICCCCCFRCLSSSRKRSGGSYQMANY